MTDYQRFINVINWLKESRKIFNNADLANVLGVSQTYVSLLMTEKKPITANLVKNLVNKFNELNDIWILTGEGSMLKVDATAQSFHEATNKESNEIEELKRKLAEAQRKLNEQDETIKTQANTIFS